MSTKTAPEFRSANTADIVRQIGHWNIAAISGGRIEHRPTGITLPVGAGYRVTVDLDWDDTYVVRQIFTRGAKTWIKGERREVYADEVAQVAYRASCYHNNYAPETWSHFS